MLGWFYFIRQASLFVSQFLHSLLENEVITFFTKDRFLPYPRRCAVVG